jgi:RNA polymerase sigma factor (sigma-70 family)
MTIVSVEGRPLDDAELVRRAQEGDVGAYEELVSRYGAIAQRAAYLITGSAAEAEDAAQQAFVKAYYAIGRFRLEAPFRPWLLRIVANEAKNRIRSQGRQAGVAVRLQEGRPRDDAAPSPEVAVLSKERSSALMEALSTLKVDDRTVIYLRYFLELSEAEMAATLACRPGTVKSRLSRALARLKTALDGHEEDLFGSEARDG